MSLSGRVCVIGDIHGCFEEFSELLTKLAVTPADRVICLGDFLDKGPYPLECLRLAIASGFDAVASNHEDRHRRWAWAEKQRRETGRPNNMRPWTDPRDAEINAQLTDAELEWIRTRPPWIEFLPGWVAVHGGLRPGVPLAEQEPDKVIRIRDVASDGKPVSTNYDDFTKGIGSPPGSVHWSSLWTGPENVVYGHEAHSLSVPNISAMPRGAVGALMFHSFDPMRWDQLQAVETWGIDTGCVHGGRLTALVFEPGCSKHFVQVQAKRCYQQPLLPIPT